MDRIIKNFWIYGTSLVNRITWDCPELVGHYKMKILMMSMGTNPFTAYQFTINSPQIVSKNSSSTPYWVYNPYNFDIDFINFINVGFSNYQMNRYICGNLSLDVMMKGQFDYQHAVFNSTWVQNGKVGLAFDYVINNKLIITAEFTRVRDEVPRGPRPLLTPNQITNGDSGVSPQPKRFIANVWNKADYSLDTFNFSIFDPRLVGKFRCRLIFNVCITGFPENVSAYLISPQFDRNTPYYFTIGEIQRGKVFGYCPNDYIGTFYGNFNYTTYSTRTRAIEYMTSSCFTWEFTEV